jgi:hypothetical protein
MMATLFLVVIACLTLFFFLIAIRGYGVLPFESSKVAERLRDVDLEAFRNLVDPDEEQYLREHLPPREYRIIQRRRMRAALDYIVGVSHNAAILLQVGQAARVSSDHRVAEAGRQLVDDAVRLRLYSIVAGAKLCTRMVFAGSGRETLGIVESYQTISHRAALLGRLQDPAKAALLSKVG